MNMIKMEGHRRWRIRKKEKEAVLNEYLNLPYARSYETVCYWLCWRNADGAVLRIPFKCYVMWERLLMEACLGPAS